MRLNFNKIRPIRTKISQEEWGSMEWLMDDTLVPEVGMSAAIMTVHAGKTSPAHAHSNCHEFIHVIEGSIEVNFGNNERIILNPGDSSLNPAGNPHGIKNVGEVEARMFLSYSAGRRKYETVP